MRGVSRSKAGFAGLCMLGLCAPGLAQLSEPLPVSARSPEDYVSLRERPLFSPERRAPQKLTVLPADPLPVREEVVETKQEAVVQQEETAVEAPDWVLVGVVRSSRIDSATFRSPSLSNAFSMRKGESRNGWTLADVRSTEVVLDSEGGQALIRFPTVQ